MRVSFGRKRRQLKRRISSYHEVQGSGLRDGIQIEKSTFYDQASCRTHGETKYRSGKK